MRKHQVLIVGAGVGGATAAFHMAKAGLDVMMIDKAQFPRDKPCGDGQVAGIHPLLRSMGIYEEIKSHAYLCHGTMFSDCREETYSYINEDGEETFATRRYIFDDIVNKAALKQGVDYLENFEATEVITRRGQAIGVRGIYGGQVSELFADMIVLANGAHSMLSRQMGIYEEDPDYVFYGLRGYYENVRGLSDVIEFHYPHEMFTPVGYIWLFPEGKTKANVGVFITERALQKTGMAPEELIWWWRDNTKLGQMRLGEAVEVGKLEGWRLPAGAHKKLYGPGFVAVGDAGNMIEPLYGGGLPHAMMAGVCAANAAAAAVKDNDFSEKSMSRYADFVEDMLGSGYKIQEFLRANVFSTTKDISELIDYSKENFQGIRMSGGDAMAKFVTEKRGYTGSTKSSYSK